MGRGEASRTTEPLTLQDPVRRTTRTGGRWTGGEGVNETIRGGWSTGGDDGGAMG